MKSFIATLLVVLTLPFQLFANVEKTDVASQNRADYLKTIGSTVKERSYSQTLMNCIFSPDLKQYFHFSEKRLQEFDFAKFENAVVNTDPKNKKITFGEAVMAVGYLEYIETGSVPKAKNRCEVLDSLGLLPEEKDVQERIQEMGLVILFLKALAESGWRGH